MISISDCLYYEDTRGKFATYKPTKAPSTITKLQGNSRPYRDVPRKVHIVPTIATKFPKVWEDDCLTEPHYLYSFYALQVIEVVAIGPSKQGSNEKELLSWSCSNYM